MIPVSLGATIRRIRVLLQSDGNNGLTTLEEFGQRLAHMLGRSRPISKSTVSRWEHDEQIPRRAVLDVIAQLGREVGVALPSQPTAGVVQAVVARAVALLSDPTHREAHAGAVARWTAELDRILPTAQSNAVGDVCRDPLLIGAVVAAVVPGVSAAPERLELRDLATGTRLLVSAAVGELMIPRP